MRIAIMGLGGVGGYYGGKLAFRYAGSGEHKIIFFVRGAHLEAIRSQGLKVITPEGEFTAFPTLATDRTAEAGPLDFILFCVKSYHLEDAARSIMGNIHESTVILPLLNGVDITERLQKILPGGIVLNGCVYIGSRLKSPGVIHQMGGSCQIIFGPDRDADTENFRYIEALLREAGIKADLQGGIAVPIWTKYIFIDPLAGLTSMLGKTFGAILADTESRDMLKGLMQEVERIAIAKRIGLPRDIVESSMEKVKSFPYETKTSMQADYEHARQTEMEIFSGYIVKAGKELGVPTPLHDRVHAELLKRK